MKGLFQSNNLFKHTLTGFLLAFGIIFSPVFLESAIEKSDKIAAADELLELNRRIDSNYFFTFHNKTFVGYPNVYSPVIFPGANKQTDIPLQPGDHFLEIGCGTGIFSILAALEGAELVYAIDINPDAVANTLENAHLHGVGDNIKVLQGDMFKPLDQCQRFDVIFFNIPFCHRNCSSDDLTMLGKSLYDPEHDLLHRYFKEGRDYLKEGGKMILGYSTTHGDINLMNEWAKKYHWQVTLLSKVGDETRDFITVEMYEFRP